MSLPDRGHLLTEQRLAESMTLDSMSILDAVALMNCQDEVAVKAVAAARPEIAGAVRMVADALSRGGRLFYIGAGTSGRLGVLDASECPPTFRTDPEMIQGIIAGGPVSVLQSQEGAEDRAADGAAAMDEKNVSAHDVVIGIAAGGTTPFVHGALARAKARQAATVFLCCVEPGSGEPAADLVIRLLVGPEVLTGSTRLKAGTATKLALNQITTLAMVQLGKVYENLMVDLRATNQKLWDRAARIVATLTGRTHDAALGLLRRCNGEVKVAVVMHAHDVDADRAREILETVSGHLRQALDHR